MELTASYSDANVSRTGALKYSSRAKSRSGYIAVSVSLKKWYKILGDEYCITL